MVASLAPVASVIVPWWNHTELLSFWETNLALLPEAEIIFVDNGSSPEEISALAEFCHRHSIQLIQNHTNLGYAAANNQGAAVAQGEYLLFFNNDLEVLQPGVIPYLCDLAGTGISGPGPLLTETYDVCVEGWALCIHRPAFQAIAGWCEDYGPGYWDDVDLCYRAVQAGYPLTYSDRFVADNWRSLSREKNRAAAYIRHLGGTTGDDGRLDKLAIQHHNQAIFTQKFYPQLRTINLVVFPDWQQPEAVYAELYQVVQTLLAHPDVEQMALLVDRGQMDVEQVEEWMDTLLFDIYLSQNMATKLTVTVINSFQQANWMPWQCRLNGRIALQHDDATAVAARGTQIPLCCLEYGRM